MVTLERLKEVLKYEPETGLFYWKVSNSNRVKVGDVADCPRQGYIQIMIDKVTYIAHRLAWLYVYGKWPDGDIDHINGVRNDNRISNLRDVSKNMNQQNRQGPRRGNKFNLLGVCQQRNRFKAQITINGKVTYIGLYDTPEEAHQAYITTKRKLHPGNTL